MILQAPVAPCGVYVTGTDTGIGKSRASVALLRHFAAAGAQCAGMKPLASGCERDGSGRWVNEDALALLAASRPRPDYDLVNPYALPAATAPDIAARLAGVRIELDPIVQAFGHLTRAHDFVVVEGVGGWMAPLGNGLMQSDLARALALPVVLVVGLRLGCLNHALLSARAIAADGLRLAGWVGCAIDPDLDFADDYRELLVQQLPVPCLGIVEHGAIDAAFNSDVLTGPLLKPAAKG